MDDHPLCRYAITQTGEHTYKLDDVLSNQTWEIEILKENHTEFIKKLKELELPKYRLENESYK